MPVTTAQLRVNRMFKRACQANKIKPCTLKHRSRLESVTTNAPTGNVMAKARSGSRTLETTTDFQVWVSWESMRVRGGAADAGDGAAGRQWIGRQYGQIPAIDTTANPISIHDQDWLIAPDGMIFEIENPVISADGSYYTFEMVTQR